MSPELAERIVALIGPVVRAAVDAERRAILDEIRRRADVDDRQQAPLAIAFESLDRWLRARRDVGEGKP